MSSPVTESRLPRLVAQQKGRRQAGVGESAKRFLRRKVDLSADSAIRKSEPRSEIFVLMSRNAEVMLPGLANRFGLSRMRADPEVIPGQKS
jgi:hypothetical protein